MQPRDRLTAKEIQSRNPGERARSDISWDGEGLAKNLRFPATKSRQLRAGPQPGKCLSGSSPHLAKRVGICGRAMGDLTH